jgi:aerobic-type carbon monoxide dehydrogenase small subunit (CoxS/CutS family)
MTPPDESTGSRFSRRNFIKTLGATAVTSAASFAEVSAGEMKAARKETPLGPGAVPVTLKVNGQLLHLKIEPRVTLTEALRYHGELTGTKVGCDRGSCGACTVLMDGEPVYSCMKLAIDAQGAEITTVEGLAPEGELNPLQTAFVETDALQCGFCTPGFLLSATALLAANPHPSKEEIKHGCSGNICRCGSQPHIVHAVQQAAGVKEAPNVELIPMNREDLA